MRYFANRIAQTELHRAYSDEKSREMVADAELTVVQVRMSATHPKTDICDFHSRLDKYGLGPGAIRRRSRPSPRFIRFAVASWFPASIFTPRTPRSAPRPNRRICLPPARRKAES